MVLAKSIAPIFKNSLIASGILPLICNTAGINEGDQLEVDIRNKKVMVNGGLELEIELPLDFQLKKIAAGNIIYFDAANELQKWAKEYCDKNRIAYTSDDDKTASEDTKGAARRRVPQTLAQKIFALNRLDGKDTVLPGETAEVRFRGVFSQDTTGPMTVDEYQAMAGEGLVLSL